MEQNELLHYLYQYVTDNILTFEERRSMGLEVFRKFVEDNYTPIPKCDLEIGKTYSGKCRNANKAVWDGEKFHYQRTKFGTTFDETINHYEDDEGSDVFVPVTLDSHD